MLNRFGISWLGRCFVIVVLIMMGLGMILPKNAFAATLIVTHSNDSGPGFVAGFTNGSDKDFALTRYIGNASPSAPSLTIISDSPDPSYKNELFLVTAFVQGFGPVPPPSGTVDITAGANVGGCTITLSKGLGNCAFAISTPGFYVLTATYKGDEMYLPSSDTENHTVVIPPSMRYVKWNAGGANNGTSWTDAYTDLQSALADASSGDQIWVAAGTYKPTAGNDRTSSFILKNGVAVYGGFAGMESNLSQRYPAGHLTILSGDIGTAGNASDNSYHVVSGTNLDSTAVLDGFTISDGTADGNNDPFDQGGGMYNTNGSPTLHNLVFSNNSAGIGTGLYNYNSSPDLLNITFLGNTGIPGSRGGALVNDFNSSPHLENVTFANNSGVSIGGAMLNSYNSNPSLVNVTFTGNSASTSGGAIYNWGSNPTLQNVTISGNSASAGGAIYNDNSSHTTVINGILYGDSGGEISDFSGSTTVSYSIVQGGYPGTGNLNTDPLLGPLANNGGVTKTMAIGVTSPAVDTGDDAHCLGTDQRGVTRPQRTHCDIGAYEYEDLTPPSVLSIVRANPSPTSASTVSFTVTFSESVTNVDATDFLLTTKGVTGASIANVTGSGTTYTVTVNTGSGNGTIRLDVVDNDSVKDAGNTPLGGVGAGNGNYTNGERYNIVIGADTVGVFRPSNGVIFLKNSNTTGYADIALNYGLGGDYPIVGDWDGNGTDTIGVYRGNTFLLRNSNTVGFADLNFVFGQVGDQPVAGDWNGDGKDTIGVYRPSTGQFLLRNSNSAGAPEISFYLGNVGDVGIAGDWNGDGIDTTGVFRPSNGIIFLKNTNATGYAEVALNYGLAGDKPVVGDWDNNGTTTIGIYRNAKFYLRNSNTNGFANITLDLGIPGDMPIAGNWDGKP